MVRKIIMAWIKIMAIFLKFEPHEIKHANVVRLIHQHTIPPKISGENQVNNRRLKPVINRIFTGFFKRKIA